MARGKNPDVLAIRGDLLEKYGYSDMDDYKELIEFYKKCAADGICGHMSGGASLWWLWFQYNGYYYIPGSNSGGSFGLYHGNDASDTEVVLATDWEYFEEFCYDMKELADLGCWPDDVMNTTQERQDGLLSGKGASMVWNVGSCQAYANQANEEHPDWNVNLYKQHDPERYQARY